MIKTGTAVLHISKITISDWFSSSSSLLTAGQEVAWSNSCVETFHEAPCSLCPHLSSAIRTQSVDPQRTRTHMSRRALSCLPRRRHEQHQRLPVVLIAQMEINVEEILQRAPVGIRGGGGTGGGNVTDWQSALSVLFLSLLHIINAVSFLSLEMGTSSSGELSRVISVCRDVPLRETKRRRHNKLSRSFYRRA